MTSNFQQKIQKLFGEGKFLLIGLDTSPKLIPNCLEGLIGERMLAFNKKIIDATADIVCGYKPNIAFYEEHGAEGMTALHETIDYLQKEYPNLIVILDFKRGDIGNTNLGYEKSAFTNYDVDAITIHPYLGKIANEPFLNHSDRGIFVLCKTSNEGSGEFQDLLVNSAEPLYSRVARNANDAWNTYGNVGLVAGAPYPAEIAQVRAAAPDCIILIPGIGAQGGDLENAVRMGMNDDRSGFLVNISRAALYASKSDDFAEAAKRVAHENHTAITEARMLGRLFGPSPSEIAQRVLSDTNAVLTGHFVYTHGDHGSAYVNKDAIYLHPAKVEQLCYLIALHFARLPIDTVVGPEKGGIILSQYVAKHLSLLLGRPIAAVYAEKAETPAAGFVLKRGYDAHVRGKNILIVEDILNTGGSVAAVIACVNELGSSILGVGAICNRGGVTAEQLCVDELFSLVSVHMDKYSEISCPLCQNNVPVNTTVGKGKAFLEKKAAVQ